MKLSFFLFLWVTFILVCTFKSEWVSPVAPDPDIQQACERGYKIDRSCCIDHKQQWYTDAVPVEEVDYIQLQPYSCANPSFCSPRMLEIGAAKAAYHPDMSDSDQGFSGASNSCGAISFLMCKHLGNKVFECYGKTADDAKMIYFTQELSCEYSTINDTEHLLVGSCVINQGIADGDVNKMDRPYADLSTYNPLTFTPILNPFAVDAFRFQHGINRVIRHSDIIMTRAFLPIPAYLPAPLPPPPAVQTTDNWRLTTVVLSSVFLSIAFFIIVFWLSKNSCMLLAHDKQLKRLENHNITVSELDEMSMSTEEQDQLYPTPPFIAQEIENKI